VFLLFLVPLQLTTFLRFITTCMSWRMGGRPLAESSDTASTRTLSQSSRGKDTLYFHKSRYIASIPKTFNPANCFEEFVCLNVSEKLFDM